MYAFEFAVSLSVLLSFSCFPPDLIPPPFKSMGRGVSSGGGQSSLGYLFGDGEAPKPARSDALAEAPTIKPASKPEPVDVAKQIPAGIHSNSADGQNTGNFITDRPSTKVHAAPGGGSSLGYLFGGGPGEGK